MNDEDKNILIWAFSLWLSITAIAGLIIYNL